MTPETKIKLQSKLRDVEELMGVIRRDSPSANIGALALSVDMLRHVLEIVLEEVPTK